MCHVHFNFSSCDCCAWTILMVDLPVEVYSKTSLSVFFTTETILPEIHQELIDVNYSNKQMLSSCVQNDKECESYFGLAIDRD